MKHIATGTLLAGAVIGLSATAAVAAAPGARPGDNVAQIRPAPAVHGTLPKAKKCKLKGTWDTDYGVTTMSSNKKGQYAASYCSAPWTVKATSRTKTGFSVAMTYTGDEGCQDFTEDMTWDGCSEASGHFTNASGGTGSDTWTLVSAKHAGPVK
ncbi:MAG TPA: hypothetical protein VMF67_16285 [Rhizomicrobium sp.]|nr:hypothetical protein [Rhizomicrobium sp.]